MTNSMIPYSFVPGTKANAAEVNANFLALANTIAQNQTTLSNDINGLDSSKANKTNVIAQNVSTASTNLNDYKSTGSYIFSSDYTPTNIPKGTSGMLIVSGNGDNSAIKQVWYCNETNPEIFTRDYSNSQWSNWQSAYGISSITNPGYLRLPNGFLIQWGVQLNFNGTTYPIAYTTIACPLTTKEGVNGTYTITDFGFIAQSLTGFNFTAYGDCQSLNWIAIGY